MSIQRCVLHHDMFGHPDTERSKVPHCLDAPSHHLVGYLLRYGNRYCQHTDIYEVNLHTCFKLIGMINRNAVDFDAHQVGIDIECSHYLQAECTRPESRNKAPPRLPTQTNKHDADGKSQKVLQHPDQYIYFITYPCTSGNVYIRKVFRYLRRIDIDLFRNLGRRNKPFIFSRISFAHERYQGSRLKVGSGTLSVFLCVHIAIQLQLIDYSLSAKISDLFVNITRI